MKEFTKKVVSPWVIFGALCLVSACSRANDPLTGSQNNPNSTNVNSTASAKNPVEQLIALCKADNYTEAARHMRYPGRDQSRKDQTANYESGDAEEKRQVEMSCRRFRAMAGLSYTVSPERMEQGFYVYDVEIKVEGKTEKQLWAFRKSGADYVLVDID